MKIDSIESYTWFALGAISTGASIEHDTATVEASASGPRELDSVSSLNVVLKGRRAPGMALREIRAMAAKNGILIVEFAKDHREMGKGHPGSGSARRAEDYE